MAEVEAITGYFVFVRTLGIAVVVPGMHRGDAFCMRPLWQHISSRISSLCRLVFLDDLLKIHLNRKGKSDGCAERSFSRYIVHCHCWHDQGGNIDLQVNI